MTQNIEDELAIIDRFTQEESDIYLMGYKHGYEDARREAAHSAWISVKDFLPKIGEEVLAYTPEAWIGDNGFGIGVGKNSRIAWSRDHEHLITHWQPLPEGQLNELRSIQAEILHRTAEPQWISVDERLPEYCTRVLAYIDDDEHITWSYEVLFFNRDRWFRHGLRFGGNVTYWQPLPGPPGRIA